MWSFIGIPNIPHPQSLFNICRYTNSYTCIVSNVYKQLSYKNNQSVWQIHFNFTIIGHYFYSLCNVCVCVCAYVSVCILLPLTHKMFSIYFQKIAITSQRLLQFILLCLSAVLINTAITPWFILMTIPICGAYYTVQRFYRNSSR